jgi:hypothetical protein
MAVTVVLLAAVEQAAVPLMMTDIRLEMVVMVA